MSALESIFKNTDPKIGKVAHQVKTLVANSHNCLNSKIHSGRKELTPESCSAPSHMLCGVYIHAYTYTINRCLQC